jgi:hypothetical protein
MILEAVLLAQLTGTLPRCQNPNIYSNVCEFWDTTTTTSAAPQPSCPDGYTLMSDLMMHPKCAKDIIEPLYK